MQRVLQDRNQGNESNASPKSSNNGNGNGVLSATSFKPLRMSADLIENEKAYQLVADVPGVAKEDIDIQIEDGVLSLKAERKHAHEEKSEKRHFVERSFGQVERRFRLPKEVDSDQIEAKFDKGVLTLTMPKKPLEMRAGKKIEVIQA